VKHKNKSPFKKTVLRMDANHTWDAPNGYKIVVADRGAVSFNVPESWFLAKMQPLELNDQAPPDDNARLTVSFWRLPPGIDWSALPLPKLLNDVAKADQLNIIERGEPIITARTDMELVWTEHRLHDVAENREALMRIALARGWSVQALLTFDLWVDDAPKFKAMWEEVLNSLQMGRVIDDPRNGMVLH